ncbi:MAG: methyltransferase domain-containing protein [Clostridia bacterium]|nr:methyltransferase domain-containing protein [Clostridia bacterium]
MDTTKKFNGIANEYTQSRPSYATEFIEILFDKYGFSASSFVADIGSGTGKFAKQLLDKGCNVVCVEPNADMRLVAEKELCEYPNFKSVAGSAENTMLPDSFVDFITTAQAFHWFDTKSFKTECSRIIKPGGKVFLIWNTRNNEALINQELHRVYSEYCPDFKGFSGGTKPHDDRIKDFFDNDYEYITFDNPLFFDREKFINRSLTGSYSLKKGDCNFELYIKEIEKIFDEFEIDGVVKIENQTVAYVGTL